MLMVIFFAEACHLSISVLAIDVNNGGEVTEEGSMLGKWPVDPNLMRFEMVVKRGMLWTFIMSAERVTSWYWSMMPSCFHYSLPRLGPQILADLIS